jgi:hypothetical protein
MRENMDVLVVTAEIQRYVRLKGGSTTVSGIMDTLRRQCSRKEVDAALASLSAANRLVLQGESVTMSRKQRLISWAEYHGAEGIDGDDPLKAAACFIGCVSHVDQQQRILDSDSDKAGQWHSLIVKLLRGTSKLDSLAQIDVNLSKELKLTRASVEEALEILRPKELKAELPIVINMEMIANPNWQAI